MASGSFALHEEGLPPDVVDRHRAIVSMMEELEAVDWYDQRVAATSDASLAEVLAHNRDEEKEHFAMTLEWLRRKDAKIDDVLRTYLFTDEDIVEVEHEAEDRDEPASPGSEPTRSLSIGDLHHESEGEL
jgi:ferritin-like protein